MRSANIQIVVLAFLFFFAVHAKLLHHQQAVTDPYLTVLNFTQTGYQQELETIIAKLKFINQTLTQAFPNSTGNATLFLPTILDQTSLLNQEMVTPVPLMTKNCVNLTK
jgi:hypothetical protein